MKHKIIIVDDSNVNRDYLKSMLEEHNYEVLPAQRGGEALDILENTEPAAMILDLNMPGIGGLETLKGIRAKGHTFPVIIFTSDQKEETRKRCLDAGANEILFKPSKPAQLLKTIEKVMAEAQA
jgi:DNA-binding response OmpR family regulator